MTTSQHSIVNIVHCGNNGKHTVETWDLDVLNAISLSKDWCEI